MKTIFQWYEENQYKIMFISILFFTMRDINGRAENVQLVGLMSDVKCQNEESELKNPRWLNIPGLFRNYIEA